ncbi:hypothetical protein HUU62_04875 [Rhodoferax sp. 4810]|nr:hypothetical protein [Rhodoferax jenense]
MRRSVDNSELERWRALDAADALTVLTDYCKSDVSFRPLKKTATQRWHVVANGHDYEIVTTGPKWWDTRAQLGGAGAVDLAMHLYAHSFTKAVRLLEKLGL